MSRTRLTSRHVDLVAGGRQPGASAGSQPAADRSEFSPQPLFRSEVADFSRTGPLGQPIANLPLSWQLMSAFLVLMAIIAVGVVCTYQFERKETARGILGPEAGEVRVFPTDRGVIREVDVTEGKSVRAGDTLFVVSTDRTERAGEAPQADMLHALDEQEASLRQRLAAINSTDTLRTRMSSAEMQALQASLQAARADLQSAQAQFEIVQDDYERIKPVAEHGFISRVELQRRQLNVLVHKQAVSDANAAIARIEAEILQHRSDAATLPFTAIKERGEIEDALAEITQRRAQYKMNRGFAIKAPISGDISALQASAGQTADPLHPMASIIPSDSQLVAVLYVPSRAVGFLRPGQQIRIRYDAFPFEKFGSVTGKVATISQTVLRPEEVVGAVRVEEPVYRVVASLDRQAIEAFGESRPLHAGMALTADIILEKHSVLGAIFEPLLARGWRP